MPFRYLFLARDPPGFGLPGETAAPTTHHLRPVAADQSEGGTLPSWVAELPERPTIYATLGTRVSRLPEGIATFAAILAALRDEPINLIVTVGNANDPAAPRPHRAIHPPSASFCRPATSSSTRAASAP